MKYFLLAILLPFLSLAQYGRPSYVQPLDKAWGEVKIATWNQNWFPDGTMTDSDAKTKAEAISSASRFVSKYWKCDVCCFQEMKSENVCQQITDAMNKISPGYKLNICSHYPHQTQQDCIISKYTAVASGEYGWSRDKKDPPPRGFVWAVLDIKGTLVFVATTHWNSNKLHGKDTKAHKKQIKLNKKMREQAAREMFAEVTQLVQKQYGLRTVQHVFLAGDFNTSLYLDEFAKEQSIRLFTNNGYIDALAAMPLEKRRKADGNGPWLGNIIDYIFYFGKGTLTKPEVAPHNPTSDHALVSVNLKLNK